jgi:tungstate transport system substrate-binding protein
MFKKRFYMPFLIMILVLALAAVQGCGQQAQTPQAPQEPAVKDVILATTTSTQDSGLLDVLVPKFEEETGYKVKTIAVGTGAALAMGEKGEADVLLCHAYQDEAKLIESGAGINHQLVMHNDFIIVGPPEDPAGIKGSKVVDAFKQIAEKREVFVSRGDNSGTHKMELKLWDAAGITPEGEWYQQSGTGMGATLNIANEKRGHTLSDRATYLAQKKNVKLDILVEGEASLLNIPAGHLDGSLQTLQVVQHPQDSGSNQALSAP